MMNPSPGQFGGSFTQAQQQPKGCIGRNWKWMLPVGCLGLILAGVALIGGIVFVAMSAMKSSEVYQGALKVVQTHPAAIERLGQPIKDGWLVQGNINVNPGGGNANLVIPVSGPKNSGTLKVSAIHSGGAWMYQKLDLLVSGETVSLLDRNVALPPGSEVDVEKDAEDSSDENVEVVTVPGTEEQPDVPDRSAVSGGALDGKAISKPQPPYPPVAKAAHASGLVTVHVIVDETGSVESAAAVSGHPLLQAAAVAAARQAKFTPTLLSGKPVRVSGTLSYNFVP